MTSFVYDFKDINSRMKGDLIERKEPSKLCPRCNGTGRALVGTVLDTVIMEDCPDCRPEPLVPSVPKAKRGPLIKSNCLYCLGSGMDGLRNCPHCFGSGLEP